MMNTKTINEKQILQPQSVTTTELPALDQEQANT